MHLLCHLFLHVDKVVLFAFISGHVVPRKWNIVQAMRQALDSSIIRILNINDWEHCLRYALETRKKNSHRKKNHINGRHFYQSRFVTVVVLSVVVDVDAIVIIISFDSFFFAVYISFEFSASSRAYLFSFVWLHHSRFSIHRLTYNVTIKALMQSFEIRTKWHILYQRKTRTFS